MQDKKATVLIVDDETVNVEYVANILKDMYELKVAYGGLQALKILEKFEIDLVLLDIQMPDIDGYEVASQMQKNKKSKDIPIIFLTSKMNSEAVVRAFGHGAKDYITKPFNAEELKARVENHLQTHLLQKKIIEQEKYLKLLLNSQPSMVILTDSYEIKFANKTFLDFYKCTSVEVFRKRYTCVCHTFIANDNYYYLGKNKSDENWVYELQALPEDKRVVSMVSHIDGHPRAFSVSINGFEDRMYIINFNDISQTMIQQMDLENKVTHDKLTNAFNREYFDQKIEEIIRKNHLADYFTAFAMVDIDHFKKVNDTYGHDIGDEVLKRFVKILQSHSRKHDVLIRWGGEEFLFVIPIRNAIILQKVLDNFRSMVEGESFAKVGKVTCSMGATLHMNDELISQTVKRADTALYEAKSSGRNRVVVV